MNSVTLVVVLLIILIQTTFFGAIRVLAFILKDFNEMTRKVD